MSRLLTLKEEAERAAEQGGQYVSPYRIAEMAKTAAKILDTLAKSGFQPSYAECDMILKIVHMSLDAGREAK